MIRIAGLEGEIKCGYQIAAKLGKWEFVQPMLEAKPIDVSDFWLSQKPLHLYLKIGKKTWRWHDVELIENGAIVRVKVKGNPKT